METKIEWVGTTSGTVWVAGMMMEKERPWHLLRVSNGREWSSLG
jgi:hypothetical protein